MFRVFLFIILIINLYFIEIKSNADEIIATIADKKIITKEELEQNIKIEILIRNKKEILNKDLMNAIRYQVFQDIINYKILYIHAKKIGIETNNIDVSTDINFFLKSLNLKNISDLKNFLYKNDINYYVFEERLKNQNISNTLIAMIVMQENKITEDDIGKKLFKMNLINSDKNRIIASNSILNERIMSNIGGVISKIKRLYYVEVY